MTLLAVVIAYLVLRWSGAPKPLHHDGWFFRWSHWLTDQPALLQKAAAVPALAIAVPALALFILLALVEEIGYWLQLLVAVPVLLYSVGRGRYTGCVVRYIRARQQDDWLGALAACHTIVIPGQGQLDLIGEGDWEALDERMLTSMSYRGFERTFAVLFWFIVLGPVGALVYRLSVLYLQDSELAGRKDARRWLWLLEWPASRVLGLSFALTGNFVGCIHAWHNYFWAPQLSTGEALRHFVAGALNVDGAHLQGPHPQAHAEGEFNAVLSLYSRTLIFWLCVLAIVTVLL
ncbi:hypothetical protein ACXYTJ_04535 [Gilvimarinus sp. F26214L]|uniref:hypothetical protein n=1 Tax=Gilvimarinus sp. DZF01 TaxID=3461371 RepID=UPI0040457691